jgi:hypothetical protein
MSASECVVCGALKHNQQMLAVAGDNGAFCELTEDHTIINNAVR